VFTSEHRAGITSTGGIFSSDNCKKYTTAANPGMRGIADINKMTGMASPDYIIMTHQVDSAVKVEMGFFLLEF
jgi:hypothetical protein